MKDLPTLAEDTSEDIISRQITALKHKQLQLKFMGEENKELSEEVGHLKSVIAGFKSLFLDEKSKDLFNCYEMRIQRLTKEN